MSDSPTKGFQEPRHVESPHGCFFYHSIDLPQYGLQVGDWDLRATMDEYLGREPLAGRRVIDIGAASGYVSFEMEKRGAEVISFDRDLSDSSDDMGLVPFADIESRIGGTLQDVIADRLNTQRRLQDSYWLSHRLLESKARLCCGNVYDGPSGVDYVDVSFFGCILLHLRDPLQAISKFARLTRQTLIITDTWEDVGELERKNYPVMVLRPRLDDPHNVGTWWWPTMALLRNFLGILGFKDINITRHAARFVRDQRNVPMFTLVARR